jgi:hypothetical protein
MPDWLDPRVANVARLLRGAGYATAHIGKWHLGRGNSDKAPSPEEYGFDFVGSGEKGGALVPKDDPYFRARSTALFVDEALGFIRKNQARPFYVQLWTVLPHATLNPTPEQLQPFAKFSSPGAPFRSPKSIYYASVTELDAQVGRRVGRWSVQDPPSGPGGVADDRQPEHDHQADRGQYEQQHEDRPGEVAPDNARRDRREHQGHGSDFHSQANAAVLVPVPQERTEQRRVQEPVVEARRGAHEEETGRQQERRGRQHGQHRAEDAEPDKDAAEGRVGDATESADERRGDRHFRGHQADSCAARELLGS